MTDEHPIIDDPELGPLTRATTELADGSILEHDWYVATVSTDGGPLEVMIEGTAPDGIRTLLPRIHETLSALGTLRRRASDAVVTRFSTGEPEQSELDEAATDLELETIEASADGTVVLHFVDTCGEHFPEGYWPAVHVNPDGAFADVTVES